MIEESSNNVDPGEIRRFDELAARWWDEDGEFRTLHHVNAARISFIEKHANLAHVRAADIGCGGGILSEALAKAGAAVTAIDMAEAPLKVARLHRHESGLDIDYRHETVERLALNESGKFDVVACMELLEHVPNPSSVVAACAQLVRERGWVFFSTLNRTPKAYIMAVLAGEYLFNILPRGTHDYSRFCRPAELDGWARSNHLELVELAGLRYEPWFKRASLSRDPAVNYIAAYQRRSSQ